MLNNEPEGQVGKNVGSQGDDEGHGGGSGHSRTVMITVNTRDHQWSKGSITFEEVVELAFPGQPYDPDGTTVEYSRGHGPDKSLRPGRGVEVKDGMIFDVERANRS